MEIKQLYQGELGLLIACAAENTLERASFTSRNEDAALRKAARIEAIKAEHPELITPDDKVDGLIAAAKNVRTQLKAAFPGVKFRVTTDRFSMGDSLHVSWTDGPESARVEAIVKQYQAGRFDGMTDSYEYSGSAWTAVFGDAKYTSCSRNYSPSLTQWASAEEIEDRGQRWEEQNRRRAMLCRLNIKAVKAQEGEA